MKIKIAYGVDMRLWKYSPFEDKPESQTYQDLITYIIKTFEFKNNTDFLIKFKDDDDELTTISSLEDFQDAFISHKQQQKKSLKLHIFDKPSIDSLPPQQQQQQENEDEKKEEVPMQSKYAEKPENENDANSNKEPSPEEINAFLSDDFIIDLLSDLFIKVFEALKESSFDVSFIECVQGIILSDDGKYDKLTSNTVWPYFMDELLPKHAAKIEMFIPMIANNGNSDMIKQWIPTMLGMMKMHHINKQQQQQQNGDNDNGFNGNFGGFPWRGRGRRGGRGWWRGGRGWRHHHGHGHGHHHGHHGWRGHGRGSWRAYGHGYNNAHADHNGHNPWFHGHDQQNEANAPSAPPMEGQNDENEQMEQEQFEYTEELVAIMNMGFTNINKIKKLLNQHKGNKEAVVQQLVSAKN